MKRLSAILAAVLLSSACAVATSKPVVNQTKAGAPTWAVDVVTCGSDDGPNTCKTPVAGQYVHLNIAPNRFVDAQTNQDGYAVFVVQSADVPLMPAAYIKVDGDAVWQGTILNIQPAMCHDGTPAGCHNIAVLQSEHVDPSTYSIRTIAAVRGAMWPTTAACSNGVRLPYGPRPGQPDNVIATDFLTVYTPEDQEKVAACFHENGWTHAVVGPFVDSDGYHGTYPAHDWRGANFEKFLDVHQWLWDHEITPVTFGHPDGWTFEQTRDAFTTLLSSPRAQRLIRFFVPSGWEPTQYGWSSCTWAQFVAWGRQTLPHAVIAIHTVTDVDAPVGTDALCNDNGKPNADGWARVIAAGLHVWLMQSAAFEDPTGHGDPNHPDRTNFQNWQLLFNCGDDKSYCNRFHAGYAGWPTFSAWGQTEPIRIIAGEFAAYWVFWKDRPVSEAISWGDAAMANGADGYLDSGHAAVPIH